VAAIHGAVCGHCGTDITIENYRACKWCAEPLCMECAQVEYCPRTKELFPNPPEGERKDSAS
jgi:hypothetical protein